MIRYHLLGRLLILLCGQFSLDLVFCACPTDVESCYEGYGFRHHHTNGDRMVDPSVFDMQSCVEHCRLTPGCIGGYWGAPTGEFECYCQFALNGPGHIVNKVTLSFGFANNTAVKIHCDDTTPSCQNVERIHSYIISQTSYEIHCGDSADGDQLHFGDVDGDYICDAICWNKNSGTLKWAKGAKTLKFIKPPNTPVDGSIGSFCTGPNSTLVVKNVNWDSKDDLLCIYSDNNQTAMLSDDNGLNPALLVDNVNCQNVPNECLFLDTPSSCAACPTTGAIQGGIYAKTGVEEFVVTCKDDYMYRGKAAALGICNPITTAVYFEDGMCIKQTPVNIMGHYSNKRINLDAVAVHKTNTAVACGWICLHDMRCTALHFRHSTGSCELFSAAKVEHALQFNQEYEVLFIKGT